MALEWIRETSPRWDEEKARIVGGAPAGIFDSRYRSLLKGELLPGDWWRVQTGGKTVGYGWLDVVWGDAEILLATDPAHREKGVGSFILERLEDEARARGLGYLYNVVRPTHPDATRMNQWLEKRGFIRGEDDRLTRRVKPKAS